VQAVLEERGAGGAVMGLRILHDSEHGHAALYCSTSDWAFGPVFYETDMASAADQAIVFMNWLPQDARRYNDGELEHKYSEWQGLAKCWEHLTMRPCARCAELDELDEEVR
jgi:hypothetical protein